MLVLTRKVGEKILIGNDIVLEVLAINGHMIRLGIEAPASMIVDREEVRVKRDRAKGGAA